MNTKQLWFHLVYTPSPDLSNEALFDQLNSGCRKVTKALGPDWGVHRIRVLVSVTAVDFKTDVSSPLLCGVLKMIADNPALDWFLVVPSAAAFTATMLRAIDEFKADTDPRMKPMVGFLSAVLSGAMKMPNLFLALELNAGSDIAWHTGELLAVPGVRRMLIIDPLPDMPMSFETPEDMQNNHPVGWIPPGIDWVVTSRGSLAGAQAFRDRCARHGVQHFHVGFTSDSRISVEDQCQFLTGNQVPVASK